MTKKLQKQYFEFIEENDSEGETWSYFVDTEMPLSKELKQMVDNYNETDNSDGSFYCSDTLVSEKELKILLKRKSKTLYMNDNNLIKNIIEPKKVSKNLSKNIAEITSWEHFADYTYKGKCFKK